MYKLFSRIFKVIGYLAIGFVIADLALVFGFARYAKNLHQAEFGLVLGAAINSPVLYNRSITALDLFTEGYVNTLVLSGGRISKADIPEAEYMRRVIHSQFKGELQLILDKEASNTYQNIYNAKQVLPKAQSIILVTDKFHLARAVVTAKFLGFSEVFWVAPKTNFGKNELVRYYFRELLALPVYSFKLLFKLF